jgi:hypothetical protein
VATNISICIYTQKAGTIAIQGSFILSVHIASWAGIGVAMTFLSTAFLEGCGGTVDAIAHDFTCIVPV